MTIVSQRENNRNLGSITCDGNTNQLRVRGRIIHQDRGCNPLCQHIRSQGIEKTKTTHVLLNEDGTIYLVNGMLWSQYKEQHPTGNLMQ